jgi:adenylate cyclase class 2
MYEVELKVRASHGPVRERLEAAAEPLGTVTQEDTYYDAPHRDFAETDEALRVRQETADDRRTVLTYKGPLVEAASKTREEAETAVESPAELRRVLDGLGFEPAAVVRKERERFALDGYTVTLDDVTDLGEFVEVETEATAEEIDAAREGAVAVLERLGLDPETRIQRSYLGMLVGGK